MNGTTEVKPAGAGDSTAEIQSLLGEIRTGWGAISNLPAEFKTMRETYDLLARDVKEVLRGLASLKIRLFFSGGGFIDYFASSACGDLTIGQVF